MGLAAIHLESGVPFGAHLFGLAEGYWAHESTEWPALAIELNEDHRRERAREAPQMG